MKTEDLKKKQNKLYSFCHRKVVRPKNIKKSRGLLPEVEIPRNIKNKRGRSPERWKDLKIRIITKHKEYKRSFT